MQAKRAAQRPEHCTRAATTGISINVVNFQLLLQDRNPESGIAGPGLWKCPVNWMMLMTLVVRARGTGAHTPLFFYCTQERSGAQTEPTCPPSEVELGKELRLYPRSLGSQSGAPSAILLTQRLTALRAAENERSPRSSHYSQTEAIAMQTGTTMLLLQGSPHPPRAPLEMSH